MPVHSTRPRCGRPHGGLCEETGVSPYPNDHPAWKAAHEAAEKAVAEANATIAAVCRELGIPKTYAPCISAQWYRRREKASNERRAELRRVAQTEIEARIKKAHAAIAKASVEAQTRIVGAGLASVAAHALLAKLPTPKQLLPPLDMHAIECLAGPPERAP